MICVFRQFPITGVQRTFSPIESRAATAAAEMTNIVEWLAVYS